MSTTVDAPATTLPAPIPPAAVALRETLPRLATGLLGFVALGASAALAEGASVTTLVSGPMLAALGTAVLTTPTLVVGNELAHLATPPDAVIHVVADTLARAGALALWLSPIVLFFAVATPAWQVVYAGLLLCLGATTIVVAAMRIAALGSTAVAVAWAALASAVALHLASATFAVF
jgi:hypothetical protein